MTEQNQSAVDQGRTEQKAGLKQQAMQQTIKLILLKMLEKQQLTVFPTQ